MDLATLLGLISGIGVIVGAIAVGGSLMLFVNPPSVIIVLGGTVAATLIKFPLGTFLNAFKVAMRAFRSKADDPNVLIKEALELSQVARKSGLLALENQTISNPFLKQGVQLAVDGNPPEFVRKTLNQDIDLAIERHETGQQIFRAIGETAPAMGMIGTLIGLVQMLSSMDDPKSIGPAMAVALLTTLYGAIIANAFALPIADKLTLRSKEERLNKSLILETISAIQEGLNPRVMETLLKTYLPDSKRTIPTAKKKAA
ncbi:MAG: flagellar motor protein PomA [Gammaproteobacteria bacterium]|nr:flagellar motor protein PomA [Gammaproteobacteria bacterium]